MWLIYLGKISYGLCIRHDLSIVICRDLMFRLVITRSCLLATSLPVSIALYALLNFCTTFVCAACPYRWLESPFLRLKTRYTHISSRPV